MITKNIPVFIHVPKNGGTYIYNSTKAAARFFLGKMCALSPIFSESSDFRFIYRRNEKFPLREINIQEEKETIFTFFSTDKTSDFIEKNNLNHSEDYTYNIDMQDSRINQIVHDSDIFSSIIQPTGVKYLKYQTFEKIFKINEGRSFEFYFPLRDPIERLKSLFFYLKSEKSKHENTHGVYKSETFKEFVISEAPNNWIASQLSELKDKNQTITEEIFSETLSLINKKNFLFFNIKEMDRMLNTSFREYGFSYIKDVPSSIKKVLSSHNNDNKNNWSLGDEKLSASLDKKYQEKLHDITKYDYRLFKFCF